MYELSQGNTDLPLVGDMGSDSGDELQIVHQLGLAADRREDVVVEKLDGFVLIGSRLSETVLDHDHAVLRDDEDILGLISHSRVSRGGQVTIGKGTLVGIGATIMPQCSIGEWCVIGAGALVNQSLPDRVLAVGVPARIFRRLEEEH